MQLQTSRPLPPQRPPLDLTRDCRITASPDCSTWLIHVAGELDLAHASRLEREIRRAEAHTPATIVVDMEAVEFIDSAGLSALVRATRRCTLKGQRLVMLKGESKIDRLLALTGLEKQLPFVD